MTTKFVFPKPDDYDFREMIYNTHPPYKLDDVVGVAMEQAGGPDDKDWVWLVKLKGGRTVRTTGGCDYTGWDCQSWSETEEVTE